jgi:hypothetical protein
VKPESEQPDRRALRSLLAIERGSNQNRGSSNIVCSANFSDAKAKLYAQDEMIQWLGPVPRPKRTSKSLDQTPDFFLISRSDYF